MNSQPVSPQVGWMDGSLTVNQDEVESFFTAFRLRAGVSAAAYSSTAFSFIFSWPILHRKHSPSRCVPHISTLILHILVGYRIRYFFLDDMVLLPGVYNCIYMEF